MALLMSADLPLSAALLNHSLPVLVLRRRPRAASGHHGQGFSIESPPEFRSRADALGKRRGAPKMMEHQEQALYLKRPASPPPH